MAVHNNSLRSPIAGSFFSANCFIPSIAFVSQAAKTPCVVTGLWLNRVYRSYSFIVLYLTGQMETFCGPGFSVPIRHRLGLEKWQLLTFHLERFAWVAGRVVALRRVLSAAFCST